MSEKLYDEDFFSWTQEQARLLRRAETTRLNAPPELDWANLAEEIEDLGKSLQRELYSRLKILIMHLLKWRYQPGMQSASWRRTIRHQRDEIGELLAQSPGMKRNLVAVIERAYPKARADAADETGLPLETFPQASPYTSDEILNEQFWPEPVDLVERGAP